MQYLRLAILFTTLIVGLQLRPERNDFVDLIQAGDAHMVVKEYSFAARAYRQAATLRPGSAVPLLRLGKTFLAQAWYDRAQTALLKAHRSSGWTPELHLQMGYLYQGLSLETKAQAHWETALAEDSNLSQARLQLGWAYLHSGAWEGARAAFETILSRWDDDHRLSWQSAHYGLGLLLAADDPALALHHFQIAAAGEDQPLAAQAITLGADLEQISSVDDSVHAASLLGQAFVRTGAWSLARQTLEQVVAVEPEYAASLAYLGHALDHLGETAEAQERLLQAVRLAPAQTLPRYLLGLYYLRHNNPVEATLQFRQALELDPDNAALYAELGRAWQLQGHYGDAENAFIIAVELESLDIDFNLLLVRFYIERLIKVRSHGLPAARDAARLDPTNADAFDLLGWAYYLSGFPEQAESALQRAVSLDPKLASARYHLGAVLLQRGQLAGANYQFWRAIDLDQTGYYRSRAMQALDLPIN